MTRKMSFDITDENCETLERWKAEHNMAYGTVINRLLHIFGPSPAKEEMITICKSRICTLYSQMDQANNSEYQMLFNKSSLYLDILSLITDDPQISVTSILSERKMKKISLAHGILIYPENSILLNETDTQMCCNASIVDVLNAGFEIPHFIFFSNKERKNYTDVDIAYIEQLCVQKWPRFQEVITNNKCSKEAFSILQIRHFGIRATSDSDCYDSYAASIGTIIIRK